MRYSQCTLDVLYPATQGVFCTVAPLSVYSVCGCALILILRGWNTGPEHGPETVCLSMSDTAQRCIFSVFMLRSHQCHKTCFKQLRDATVHSELCRNYAVGTPRGAGDPSCVMLPTSALDLLFLCLLCCVA